MKTAIQIRAADMVATATEAIAAGEAVRIVGIRADHVMTAREEIGAGHKIALADIEEGTDILKYGEVIGAATERIAAGSHVHVHNCRGRKARRFAE